MDNIADQLPPEIVAQLHPDRRKNEAAYWAARDGLLDAYRGQWIGFADGEVVASGSSPVKVFHAAESTGRHPFVICVGREGEPSRVRRATFRYDAGYAGEPMPQMDVEFRSSDGSAGVVLDRVIPDTGADVSVLPWADCQRLKLIPSMGAQSLMSGVVGSAVATLAFQTWARIDGLDYPCRLHADFVGDDRILGRDVLNGLDILFRGPAGEVVVNP